MLDRSLQIERCLEGAGWRGQKGPFREELVGALFGLYPNKGEVQARAQMPSLESESE